MWCNSDVNSWNCPRQPVQFYIICATYTTKRRVAKTFVGDGDKRLREKYLFCHYLEEDDYPLRLGLDLCYKFNFSFLRNFSLDPDSSTM